MILKNAKFSDVCENLLERMDEECEKAPEHLRDGYFAIANYIRERITSDRLLADAMNGKSIAGAYRQIEEEAIKIHKHSGGNCVFIPPEKAIAIVSAYCFGGIKSVGSDSKSARAPIAPITPKKEGSGIVDLFDLI